MPEAPPRLVLLAHGTEDPDGLTTLASIRDRVASRLSGAEVTLALLGPGPATDRAEVVLADPGGAVVVPFLLGDGHHVLVDVPALLAHRDDVLVTAALGFGEPVLEALADRVRAVSGHETPGAVVLTAAGSSRARARAQVRLAAAGLRRRLGVPVGVAFLSGPGPSVPEALARVRRLAGEGPAVLAAALLAPGVFHERLRAAAAQQEALVTEPMGTHPAVLDLVAERWRRSRLPRGDRPSGSQE